MNGLERILAAVGFQPTDRVPGIPLVFGHAAALAGIALPEYLRSADCLVRCQLAAQERYGYDAVYAFMDAFVETEAIGSQLSYRTDVYPHVAQYALSPGQDPVTLKMPDPARDGRMPEVLKAAAALRRTVGDRVLVVGALAGPMSLISTLMGLEETLYYLVDAPEAFAELLDYASDVAIAYGLAQIHAGVHVPVVFDPSSSPAVIPPAFFNAQVLPRMAKIFAAFADAGAPGWLNIPGPILPILARLPEAGINIVSLDYEVPVAEVLRLLPRTVLAGNIRSLDFVLAPPEQIFQEACAVREAMAGRGGWLLSSGSEVPLEAKPENVHAMLAACAADAPCRA